MVTKEYDQIVLAQTELPQFHIEQEESNKLQLVYQYRNFDSFWSIIQSDSFWATNARFSNDEAEQQFGMQVISSISKSSSASLKAGQLGLDENYIICFCQENDKLSQWRGYAPKGGVALGFDFGMPRAFSIQQNQPCESGAEDILQYVGLDKVRYISPKGEKTEEEYQKECQDSLALISCPINDELDELLQEIQTKAPFIKHSGFAEEDEYRLVFRNQDGQLNQCINYRDTHEGLLKYPYVVVKCRLPKNPRSSAVRVCVSDKEKELTNRLEAALKATHPTLVHACHLSTDHDRDADEPFCTGCVLRRWQTLHSYKKCRSNAPNGDYEYYLHEDANCIVITQGENQKEVFEIVHKEVQEFCRKSKQIPVWCEGHLPLRSITVGPCVNQNNMVEAIRHYCKHTYWLKDVSISASQIPYRNSL